METIGRACGWCWLAVESLDPCWRQLQTSSTVGLGHLVAQHASTRYIANEIANEACMHTCR